MGLKKAAAVTMALTFVMASTVSAYADSYFDGTTSAENAEMAKEYIAEVIEYIQNNYVGGDVSTDKLVEAAINGIAHSLDDYTEYYTKEQYDDIVKSISSKIFTAGIDFELNEEGYPCVTAFHEGSAAYIDGVRMNDIITAIDGVSTKGLGIKEIESLLTSSKSKTIHMEGIHRGRNAVFDVNLLQVDVKTVYIKDLSSLIGLNDKYKNEVIGYIKINQIADCTDSELSAAIRELKRQNKTKLILDLRGNTGGYVEQAISICKQLVPAGRIIYTKDRAGNITEYTSYLEKTPFEETVVLVDNMTASASEIVASAIQESGSGVIVGQQTYGKGVMQSIVDLSEMGYLKITAFEYFTRTGKSINNIGVVPDIKVSDVLFVTEDESYSSARLRAALSVLGYDTASDYKVKRSLGAFQRKEGIPVTYKMDEKTTSLLNESIYHIMNETDRILLEGYITIAGTYDVAPVGAE